MVESLYIHYGMITERKRWMTYTYFNPHPGKNCCTTHLFSPVKRSIQGMVCVPFPTMVIDLTKPDFHTGWAASTRTKINKAIREELTVDRGSFLLGPIVQLFQLTAAAKGLHGHALQDIEALSGCSASAVYLDGVLLCGHLWLVDEEEKRALLYVNASQRSETDENRSLTGRAHYFLLWQDGLHLRDRGIITMDLMGYEKTPPHPSLAGVYQWKAGTHGQEVTVYHYYPWWFFLLRKLRNMLTG